MIFYDLCCMLFGAEYNIIILCRIYHIEESLFTGTWIPTFTITIVYVNIYFTYAITLLFRYMTETIMYTRRQKKLAPLAEFNKQYTFPQKAYSIIIGREIK